MKQLLFIACLLLAFADSAVAQRRRATTVVQPEQQQETYADSILARYTDSLTTLREHYDSRWEYKGNDLLKNPYYYRLFLSPTFYYAPITQSMCTSWLPKYGKPTPHVSLGLNIADVELRRDSAINNILADFYVTHPQHVSSNESAFQQSEGLRKDIASEIGDKVEISKIVTSQVAHEDVIEPVTVVSKRPNFWTLAANMSINMNQYYYSETWRQGGENQLAYTSTFNASANYFNQRKVKFNNSLQLRLGYKSEKADTIHPYRVSDNYASMTNQLNITAVKNWSYSLQLISTTQLVPAYNVNSKKVIRDIFSPITCNLSIGMNWAYTKKKFKINSFNIGALSYQSTLVDRKNLRSSNGIKTGHYNREAIGTTITSTYSWTIAKDLSCSGDHRFFTNYSCVQYEWKNTIKLAISKLLQMQLYTRLIFRDDQADKHGHYRAQFHENLLFGFAYTF